jgi:hypothetical protein
MICTHMAVFQIFDMYDDLASRCVRCMHHIREFAIFRSQPRSCGQVSRAYVQPRSLLPPPDPASSYLCVHSSEIDVQNHFDLQSP